MNNYMHSLLIGFLLLSAGVPMVQASPQLFTPQTFSTKMFPSQSASQWVAELSSAELSSAELSVAEPSPAEQFPAEQFPAEQSAGGTKGGHASAGASTKAVKLDDWRDLKDIIPPLAQKQVVFIGETHTRLDHHLNQLAIIRGLYKAHPNLSIGVEYFQQPYQKYLDRYVAGDIDETELLLKTQYYRRWGYDFRLYAPIFQFIREHKIPVIALNVPTETIEQVKKVGISGLTKELRATLPEHMDNSDPQYRKQLVQYYEAHPDIKGSSFKNFYDVQLSWDEGMADCAARYLQQNPDRPLVILSGTGHVAYGLGIPQRLTRRVPATSAIVLNDWPGTARPGLTDYLLFSSEHDLPRAGKLGVYLTDAAEPGARVDSFVANSAAQLAGIKQGDWIVAVDEGAVNSASDAKARLWNMKPGEKVVVKVRRSSLLNDDKNLTFAVTLR